MVRIALAKNLYRLFVRSMKPSSSNAMSLAEKRGVNVESTWCKRGVKLKLTQYAGVYFITPA